MDKSLTSAVQWAIEQGFCVIPIEHAAKKPIFVDQKKELRLEWKEYQSRKPTEEEINDWFYSGSLCNVAVVCGRISGNLVVVDFDDPKIFKKIYRSIEGIAKDTLVVKTGKGIHVYFKTQNPIASFKISQLAIDIKAEGGYVLFPPSKHPSGNNYEFARPPTEPMFIEGDFKEELLELIKQKVKDFDPNLYREEIDIEKILEGVKEGARNDSAIKLATWYRRQKMTMEETLEKMELWNDRNEPPMNFSELESVVKSAYRSERPYAYKFSKVVREREFFSREKTTQANKLLDQMNVIPYLEEKALADVIKERELKIWLFFLNLAKESVQVHGPTSTGKSHTCDKVMTCFPKHTWFKITGVSDKAIRYLPMNIHTLYLAEWRAVQGIGEQETTAQFDIKLVISEGKLDIIVVETNEEGRLETRLIETSIANIVSTSTAVDIPIELLNRIWEMTTDKRINPEVVNHKLNSASSFRKERVNCEPYRKLLRCAIEILWKEAPKDFVVPYAKQLRPLLEPLMDQPRVRRDVDKLLEAIKAVALLHYRNRPIIEDHIVCMPQDFYYAWLYGHKAIVGTFTERTERYNEVIDAVKILSEKDAEISSSTLGNMLRIGTDQALNWLKKMENDNIVTRAGKKGQGGRYLYIFIGDVKEKVKVTISMADLFQATKEWFEERKLNAPKFRIPKPDLEKFLQEKIETVFPIRKFGTLEERAAEIAKDRPEVISWDDK